MEYRTLGKSGLLVSHLGFGTMRLPIGKSNPSFDQAINLIQYAVGKGINHFDVGTFYCHGFCEEVFGEATKDIPRDRLLISGKNTTHQSNSKSWLDQLANSLNLFHREYFDLYFLHYLDYEIWAKHFVGNKVIDQIYEAFKRGLIKHLAFSSHDSPENIRKLIDTGMFDAVLLQFNIINRRNENVLRYAHENGLGVFTMSAMAGKALADNKLSLLTADGHGGERVSTKAVALNYVFSQPFIHCVLVGMDSLQALDEAINVLDGERYPGEELENMSKLVDEERVRLSIPCTACQYCMPCVQGIDIPGIIDLVNQYCLLHTRSTFSRDYATMRNPAECCIACGTCIDKCPAKIDVPEIMKKAVEMFSAV